MPCDYYYFGSTAEAWFLCYKILGKALLCNICDLKRLKKKCSHENVREEC